MTIAPDDALTPLQQQDARKARPIEMRCFGGLTAEEPSIVMQMDVGEVRRELRVAQAWLQRELEGGHARPAGAGN